MATLSAPNYRSLKVAVPAAGAAVVQDQVIGEAPFAGEVVEVTFTPEANLTANATNFRTFRVINKGQDGNGTTVVATFATDTVTTDDLADFDEKSIPLTANIAVVAGDILAVDETVAGTGVAHSGYNIEVILNRTVAT